MKKLLKIFFISMLLINTLNIYTYAGNSIIRIDGVTVSKDNPYYHNAILDENKENILTPAVVNNIETGANAKVYWNEKNGEATININNLYVDSNSIGIEIEGNAKIILEENTINTITSVEDGIKISGDLFIEGNAKLEVVSNVNESSNTINAIESNSKIFMQDITLIATGTNCITAPNVNLKNLDITLIGSQNGIFSTSTTEDVYVKIDSCKGSITGLARTGVRAAGLETTVDVLNSSLIVNGNQGKNKSATYYCAGFYVSSSFDENVIMNIKNCDSLYASGGNAGIILNNSLKENTKPVLLNIESSNVITETNTYYWAAIFMNNAGLSETAAAKVNIKDNALTANAPKDVGIMTATAGTKADSFVEIKDSVVNLDGVAAGIRVRSTLGEKEDAVASISNSIVTCPMSKGIDTQVQENGKWVDGTMDTSEGCLILDKSTEGIKGNLYNEVRLNKDITLVENVEWSALEESIIFVEKGVLLTLKSDSGEEKIYFENGGEISVNEEGKLIYKKYENEIIDNNKYNSLYKIEIINNENGEIKTNQKSARKNSIVKIFVKCNDGYNLEELKIKTLTNRNVEYKKIKENEYEFEMPSSKVSIIAKFEKSECTGLKEENCISLKYKDIDVNKWYHHDIDFVLNNGIMIGYNNEIFGINDNITRGQVVTMLWRLENKPIVNYYMQYRDVNQESYYSEAIRWATSEKIVNGYDKYNFKPDDFITREQLATMIYRYEQYKGGGFVGAWMFRLNYKDIDTISEYAYEPLCWCTMNKIIKGFETGRIEPKLLASRAEAAAILARYLKKG